MLRMFCVLFVGLKLAEVIDWDWFWVVSPAALLVVRYTLREGFRDAIIKRRPWALRLGRRLWS